MAYWDTSCLVKLYAAEPDSALFRAHVLSRASLVTSEISRLELWATLRRKESAGDLLPGGARLAIGAFNSDVLAGLILTEPLSPAVVATFDAIVEQCYARTPPIPLRTLDVIHLATAFVRGETELVATDRRLREVAVVLGMVVYPP